MTLALQPVLTACAGPPGQVAALAGKKDGMKQGELAGVLKDLGYNSDQVRVCCVDQHQC